MYLILLLPPPAQLTIFDYSLAWLEALHNHTARVKLVSMQVASVLLNA